MEALIHPGGDPAVSEPGPHESWRELAQHSASHDQLSTAVPDPGAYARFTAARQRAAARYQAWLHGLPGAG